MNFLTHASLGELAEIIGLAENASRIKRHYDLFDWLQNRVHQYIPHNVLITAWGDFSLGLICHDIVSPINGMRTEAIDEKSLLPFLTAAFKQWEAHGHHPHALIADAALRGATVKDPLLAGALSDAGCGLVHGIKDKRGRHDCLYIFLGPAALSGPRAQHALRFLLPHMDAAFRQISPLPTQQHAELPTTNNLAAGDSGTQPGVQLSAREMEIMQWVRLGKTNQEIGMILDISAFTVKNHLQRIFKKLNVSNRAQAASIL